MAITATNINNHNNNSVVNAVKFMFFKTQTNDCKVLYKMQNKILNYKKSLTVLD